MKPLGSRMGLSLALVLALPAWGAPKKAAPKEPTKAPAATPTGVAVSTETPVSVLALQLDSSIPAQEDAASRLSRYMLSKSSNQAYVSDEVKADADSLKRLNALPIVWVKKRIETKQAGKVAMLYFVMGEDMRLGSWAKPYPLLRSVEDRGTERAKILETNMELYTKERDKAVKDNPGLAVNYVGQYTGAPKPGVSAAASLESWVFSFFDFAADRSLAILSETRVKKEISDSILAHEEQSAVPGVGTKKSRAEERDRALGVSAVSAFDFAGCYERGGAIAYIPTEEKGGYRRISIKVYSVMEGSQVVNKLGIFDVSYPGTPPTFADSKIFGQMFPLDQSGESVFRLDDRKADGAMYKLVMGEDGSIAFSNPTNGENAIKTSLNGLLEARKAQLLREGGMEVVNGRRYRVMGQGGFQGGWLYFPIDDSGALTGESAGLMPAMSTALCQPGPNGPERMPGPRPLGFSGSDTAGKPLFHYLVWNADIQPPKFEPKTCEELKARCDFPPVEKPKDKKAKDKKDGAKPKKEGEGAGADEEVADAAGDGGETAAPDESGEGGHGVETASGFTKKCAIKATDFKGGAFEERKMSGWTVFVSQSKEAGNSAQICLNDTYRQTFVVSGIIAKINDSPDGEVVIETFSPESFVDPTYLTASWKVVNNEIVSGTHKFKLAGHYITYVPKSNLRPDAFKALSDSGMAQVDKVARVRLDVDVMNKDAVKKMDVYLRNTSKAADAVASALAKHAPTSPLYTEAKHKAKLLDYIKAEVAKDSGQKAEPNAYATIVLFLSSELSNTGSETGTTDNYKEIVPFVTVAKDSAKHKDKLVYCGVTSSLETLTEHAAKGHVPK